jgi:hypothetical protein
VPHAVHTEPLNLDARTFINVENSRKIGLSLDGDGESGLLPLETD